MSSLSTFSYDLSDLSLMPERPTESNKSTFGRVLCICGSKGMAGAAYLCGKAVLRSGAGLCALLIPEDILNVLQSNLPEAVASVYDPHEPYLSNIEKAIKKCDAVVCGCGFSVSRESLMILRRLLHTCIVPTVLDADALNIIAKNPSLLKYAKGKIITPHPAEMSRLTGISVNDILNSPLTVCRDFAKKHSLVCVLKGHNTCVSDGGDSIYVNTSGNSGMATAGSGDVLAGIIGAILTQGRATLSPFECACLGVYVHGLAGDAAAAELGEYSVMASDIIASIPKVLKEIQK